MAENKPFSPACWLKNPHLQTFWPFLFRFNPKPDYQCQQIKLPDGDHIRLDCLNYSPGQPNKTLVVLIHGLQGSAQSHYIRGIANTLSENNFSVIVLNRRPLYGHGAHTDDLDYVARELKKTNQSSSLNIVAVSLGGAMMLNWLSKTNDITSLVTSAAAISVPFDLASCARKMEHGFSRIYQYYLISNLKAATGKLIKHLSTANVLPNWKSSRTFYQFDGSVTAPFHGYLDADDYYQQASTKSKLKNIGIPLLLIQARDDPFMSDDVIPADNQLNDNTQLEIFNYGGHVGFVSNKGWKTDYWLDQRIKTFFLAQN